MTTLISSQLAHFQVPAESHPKPVGPPSTAHFMVLADTPMGLQPLNPFPNGYQLVDNMDLGKVERAVGGDAAAATADKEKTTGEGGDAAIASTTAGSGEQTREAGVDNETAKDVKPPVAIPKSIAEAGLRTDQYAKQLAAMKTKGAAPGRDWEDQETLLLLEAMELHKDDWNRVADHVGTRTQEECIMRMFKSASCRLI